MLFVGSVFNRRHLPDLIRAFKPIAKNHAAARLEIVGDNRTHPHEDLPAIAATAGIASQVSIRPYVHDAELAELYGRARAFALLSEYEGFGHPPLEALGSGVPSVLARHRRRARSVRRRGAVCGEGRYRRHDGRAEQPALRRGRSRQRVLDAGPAVLARYSWTRAGAETLAALESGGVMDLAIVIVSYNTRSDLENCLQSLHDHPPHASHEIVVVDNASRDGSVDAVRSRWPGVTRHRTQLERWLRVGEQRRHPRDRERAGAAAQQRHHRAGWRDRSPRSVRCASFPAPRSWDRRSWTAAAARSCRTAG